jgi:phosphopantetheinyl transferase
VIVWVARLEDPGRWAGVLGPDERAAAGRFRRPADASRYVAGRGILRTVLGRRLGQPPAALRFRYGPKEQPILDGHRCAFSVAHCGDLALIAIAPGGRVGVDLERIRDGIDVEAVAGEFFPAAARRALARVAPARRARAFFRAWVRHEALVKATGRGLVFPADARPEGGHGLWVRPLRLDPEYAAAVAGDGPRPCVRLRRFEPGAEAPAPSSAWWGGWGRSDTRRSPP